MQQEIAGLRQQLNSQRPVTTETASDPAHVSSAAEENSGMDDNRPAMNSNYI